MQVSVSPDSACIVVAVCRALGLHPSVSLARPRGVSGERWVVSPQRCAGVDSSNGVCCHNRLIPFHISYMY